MPIVEPEVLMAGDHTLSRCGEVTEEVLHEVFSQLHTQGVVLEGMLLKPNMILRRVDLPGPGIGPDRRRRDDHLPAAGRSRCSRRDRVPVRWPVR